MAIRVVCACGQSRLFPDTSAGQAAKCRKCGAAMTVAGEKIVAAKVSPLRRYLPVALILVVPALVIFALWKARQPRFTPAMEEYKDGSKAPVDPAVDGPRLERLFASLAAASKVNNDSAFRDCFHGRRMLAEIETRGGMSAIGIGREELEIQDALYGVQRKWCESMYLTSTAWQSVHRCTYKFLEGRGEAEATVIMRAPNSLQRFRFWAIKENDAWLIYDYESLESAERMSTQNAKLLARIRQGTTKDVEAAGHLERAEQWIAREKFDDALKELKLAEEIAPPGSALSVIELLQATALLRLERKDEALVKVDSALRRRKDLLQALLIRGAILYHLERYEDCIRTMEEYLKGIGEDAAALFWIGMAYEGMKKPDEARKAYRRGADCDETDTNCRERLKELGK